MDREEFWNLVLASFVVALLYHMFIYESPIDDIVESQRVTFEDVKPIFQKNCKYCHVAPHWDWTNYEKAYAKRTQIRHRVWVLRNMPLGRKMAEKDRARIRDWVDQGAKK